MRLDVPISLSQKRMRICATDRRLSILAYSLLDRQKLNGDPLMYLRLAEKLVEQFAYKDALKACRCVGAVDDKSIKKKVNLMIATIYKDMGFDWCEMFDEADKKFSWNRKGAFESYTNVILRRALRLLKAGVLFLECKEYESANFCLEKSVHAFEDVAENSKALGKKEGKVKLLEEIVFFAIKNQKIAERLSSGELNAPLAEKAIIA